MQLSFKNYRTVELKGTKKAQYPTLSVKKQGTWKTQGNKTTCS